MIKNFFTIAWRNLKKNRGFTAINIIGLAIGMAAAMLIMTWVKSEVSFDRIYPKTDQIYAVGTKEQLDNEIDVFFSTPKPLAQAIKNEFPEVENITRLSGTQGLLFTIGEKKIVAGFGQFVDSTFLDIFELPLLSGDPANLLKDPNHIILTEKLANNLFGTTDVVGQTIRIDSAWVLTVQGVLKDIPSNSRFAEAGYFLPWTFMEKIGHSDEYWGNSSVRAFVELNNQADLDQVQLKIQKIIQRNVKNSKSEIFLQSLHDQWLYSKFENGIVVGGRIELVKIFVIIACFILLIACINFMNLSTAQSEKRAKEVGIRKVVGAHKSSLIIQFLSESFLIALISGILAILLLTISLPAFSHLVDRQLTIGLTTWTFWGFFLGFIFLTGILAGSYPAIFLSSFSPIKVLKGKFAHMHGRINPRKLLVVTQFSIAILLIISTLVLRKQIQFGQNRESGYNKENLIYIPEKGTIEKNAQIIKKTLLDQGIASSVSRTMSPITERWSGWNGFSWPGKDPNSVIEFNRQSADDKIVETAGFTLIAGRDFDLNKFPTDSTAAIINESALKIMNLADPIGSYIIDGGDMKFHIIGVIKDIIQESPFDPVKPLVIEGPTGWMSTMHIKFNPILTTREALEKTEKVFKEFNSEYPFEYKFIDEQYAKKFNESEKIGKLASLFALLTIFISCLGLFGLAAFMAENKIKEIGIRKVLGASVLSVTRMLSREFVSLVSIACLIAFPIAYWAMDQFLTKYTYRISISWDIFLIAGVSAILITLLTISYQSIKAAIANPINSLRDE